MNVTGCYIEYWGSVLCNSLGEAYVLLFFELPPLILFIFLLE